MSITRTASREEFIDFINGLEYEDRWVARVVDGHFDEWIAETAMLNQDNDELVSAADEDENTIRNQELDIITLEKSVELLEAAAVEDEKIINVHIHDIMTLETEKEFLEDDVDRLEEEVKELKQINNTEDWRP